MQEAWSKALTGVIGKDGAPIVRVALAGPDHRMGPDETERPERGDTSQFTAPNPATEASS